MSNSPKNIEELAASLSDRQKKAVTLGCLFLMFTIAAYGLSLSTIQGPILNRLNGADYFSLLTLIASLAMCIMTPVGGRLGDMIGTRKVVLYSGLVAIVSGLIISFTSNLYIFLIFRFVLALAQGTFVTAPYILVREINAPKDVPKAMGLLTAALAVGSLTGSYLAGVFTDMNMMTLAILFPVLSLAAAIPLIRLELRPENGLDQLASAGHVCGRHCRNRRFDRMGKEDAISSDPIDDV
jgi:MFS family permease